MRSRLSQNHWLRYWWCYRVHNQWLVTSFAFCRIYNCRISLSGHIIWIISIQRWWFYASCFWWIESPEWWRSLYHEGRLKPGAKLLCEGDSSWRWGLLVWWESFCPIMWTRISINHRIIDSKWIRIYYWWIVTFIHNPSIQYSFLHMPDPKIWIIWIHRWWKYASRFLWRSNNRKWKCQIYFERRKDW